MQNNNLGLSPLNTAVMQNRANKPEKEEFSAVKLKEKQDNKKLLLALAAIGATTAAGVAIYKHKTAGLRKEFQKLLQEKDSLSLEDFQKKLRL